MADLGAIAVSYPALRRQVLVTHAVPPAAFASQATRRTYVVFWDGVASLSTDSTGSLSGVVEEAATPLSRCMVRVYYRPTGTLIRSAVTEADGSFELPGLNPGDVQNYFVVAFDPAGGTQYNALIFDRLTAV
jgi:hypothetical protein